MKYLLVTVLLFAGIQGVFSQDSADRHNDLGLKYYTNGQYDDAISEFTEAIKENPHNADFFFNRGFTCFQKSRKDWEQIKSDYTEAIKLDVNHAAAYFWRGYAYQHHYLYYEKADYQSAIKAYTDVLRIDPQDTLALHNRGVLFHDAKDYSRAITDYTEALKIDPNNGSRDTKWYLDVAARSRNDN